MDTLIRDLTYAVRTLLRMRATAIVAIATLAIGIGATTTMFSVVYASLLRPVPFAWGDRLVILFNTQVTPRDGLVRLRWSWPHILELQKTLTSYEAMASFTSPLVSISGDGDPEQISSEVVSHGYFATLHVRPIAGRVFDPEEDTAAGAQPVTIISSRLWKRRFAGDPAMVGRTLRVNDVPLTVIGIIARLKNGVALEQANAELAALGSRFAGEGPPDAVWSAGAVSLGAARI